MMNTRLPVVTLLVLCAAACDHPPPSPRTDSVSLAVKSAGTTVGGADGGASSLSCGSPEACFQIDTNGANITHVFIDVGACCAPDPHDYTVLVDGQPVTHLHEGGGPCQDLVRDAWFPLQGNQATAEVCLVFHGFVPSRVGVGAKAKDECVSTAMNAATCTVCGDGGSGDCGAGGAGTGTGTGGAGTGTGGAGTGTGGADAGTGGSANGTGGTSTTPLP